MVSMKLKVPKSSLDKAVKAVSRAIPNKSIQPILNNILMVNQNGHLCLNATDLDFFIEAKIPSENLEPGSITLSAKKLEEIVSKLGEDEVSIEVNKDNLETHLSSDSSVFDLYGVSSEDFPKVEKPDLDSFFRIDKAKFSKMVNMVSFAASRFDLNSIISGVYIKVEDGHLEMTATDGNRLTNYKVEIESDANSMPRREVVVPIKVIVETQKILEASVDDVLEVSFLSNQIVFKTEDRFVISRLLDGVYPKYEQLIPEESSKTAQIDRAKFLSALERVSVMVNERTNMVKLSFTEGNVAIGSENSDFGEAHDNFEIEYLGDPIDISFNVKFLLEALKALDSSTVQFLMNKSDSPAILKPVSDDKYICLVMPINPR